MERNKGWAWMRRVLALLVLVVLVVAGAAVWRVVDIVASELLATRTDPLLEIEILEVGASRVVLADSENSARRGVWGLVAEGAYGQVVSVIARGNGRVERGLVMFTGAFTAGDVVAIDPTAFPPNPRAALGLPFEEIRVPGDLGANPAWLLGGESDTWVVFVHGRGGSGRAESLRSLPAYRKLGFPILVITYRNDEVGGIGDDGPVTWGLDEWGDVGVALEAARLRGAQDFVLVGHDMGATIVLTFMHESPSIRQVRGVILDSPVLDLESLIDMTAKDRGIPEFLTRLGKTVARIRFGLEWSKLDQVGRSSEFDPSIPVLLLQGGGDVVAAEIAEQFAASLPHVEYVRFEDASHGALWNLEPVRYEEVVIGFLERVSSGLVLEP